MSSVIALLASSPAMFVGTSLVLGLAVGSFLNVVIYRLPIMLERQWREEYARETGIDSQAQTLPAVSAAPRPARFNLIVPRSACPSCGAAITALRNIPLISWLALRGRCASCGRPIGTRYPLVEALTGILSAAVAWKLGVGWPALAALVFTWFLIALTFIDIDRQLLPDSLTLPLLWIGLTLSLWLPAGGGGPLPVDTRSSLWSVYHVFRLLTGKEGMGYGDFKLLAALGAWLGWQMLLPVVLIAAVLGSVVGIAMLTIRGRHRGTPIAFGPFLAVGGWVSLMYGHELAAAYLGLFTAPP